MTTPILIAALLAALYWLRYCRAGPGWVKSAVKTGSVLGLALAAWLAGGPVLLLAALLASALGDFLLSREGEGPFIAGVAAFAAGHVAYVLLFLDHSGGHPGGAPDTLSLPVAYTLASALVLLCGVMGWLLWHRAGALRLPVLLYIPVILAMGLAALTVPLTGALALVLAGALLFVLSDTLLALERFVLARGHPMHRLAPFAVWPTYWGAQLSLTLGFTLP